MAGADDFLGGGSGEGGGDSGGGSESDGTSSGCVQHHWQSIRNLPVTARTLRGAISLRGSPRARPLLHPLESENQRSRMSLIDTKQA